MISQPTRRSRSIFVSTAATLVGAALGLAGACGGQPDTDENSASSSEALSETTCTTAPITPSQIAWAPPSDCSNAVFINSPDATYNPPGCINGWIAELNVTVPGPAGYNPFDFGVNWTDAALTATTCPLARMSLFAWDKTQGPGGPGGSPPPFWTAKGSVSLKGVWSNNRCVFQPLAAGGATTVTMTPTAGQYSFLTRASAEARVGLLKKKVGIWAAPHNSCIK